MHEMGIVQSILSSSFEVAEREGATRITEITISVGELTEIVEFALQFAFESFTPGTIAEGATLTVNHIGASSRCADCSTVFEHGRFEVICPECGSIACIPVTGRELNIDSIDIDDPEDGDSAQESTSVASSTPSEG